MLAGLTASSGKNLGASAQISGEEATDYSDVIQAIDLTAIRTHVAFLSSLGSRVTGYEGSEKAAEYIAGLFREYGLEPGGDSGGYFQYYPITVPIDSGANITVEPGGPIVKAYPLWPNTAQASPTPPSGMTGRLVYVGYGTLNDLDVVLRDSALAGEGWIALMEFNSWNNWVEAARLGAKAIVFIEPTQTMRLEAETKFLITPLYMPRLYVSSEDGALLRSLSQTSSVTVRLRSSMRYQVTQARNVVGVIKGTDFPDDVIILSAHYDDWSIVPSLAPGADDATGMAALIELARFFAEHPPRRTLWFVGFSGHWEALAGPRDFVETYYFSSQVLNGSRKIWMHINFDFSTDSDRVLFTAYGGGYGYRWYGVRYANVVDTIQRDIFGGLRRVGFDVDRYVDAWLFSRAFMFMQVIHDAEPSAVARGIGLAFMTSGTTRIGWNHPLSTLDKVSFERLYPQLVFSWSAAYTFSRIDSLGLKWDNVSPSRRGSVVGGEWNGWGYGGVVGDVTRYNYTKRWYSYDGLENLDFIVELFVQPSMYNPFMHFVTLADGNFSFTFKGVGADTAYNQLGTGMVTSVTMAGGGWTPVRIRAFGINRTTGAIEWAPDSGLYGWPQQVFGVDRDWKQVRVSVFRSSTIVLFDVLDPRIIAKPRIDYNTRTPMYDPYVQTKPFSFKSHGPLIQWGIVEHSETMEPLDMVFTMPQEPTEMTITSLPTIQTGWLWVGGGEVITLGLLVNASEAFPEGTGWTLKAGETVGVDVPKQSANDLYWLDAKRLGLVRAFNTFSPMADMAQLKAGRALESARAALRSGDEYRSLMSFFYAWNWGVTSYIETRSLITNLTSTSIFFALLLVPFAVVAERFFLPSQGKRRLLVVLAMFTVPFLTLSLLHPGFSIAISAPLATIGLALLILSSPVLATFLSEIMEFLKRARQRLIGLHFTEISRASAVIMAFSLGIQQMRKRKLRTLLTLASIVLITSAMIMLTSTAALTLPRVDAVERPTPYSGVLFKVSHGSEPVPEYLGDIASLNLSAQVSARAWKYPNQANWPPNVRPYYVMSKDEKIYQIWAVAGMMPTEELFTNVPAHLLSGRWFTEDDFSAAILPKDAAEALDAKVGDTVEVMGLKLSVVGTIDAPRLDQLEDLDGKPTAPVDQFVAVKAVAVKIATISYRRVLIVPYTFANAVLSAPPYTMAVKAEENPERFHEVAENLVIGMRGAAEVFVGYEGRVWDYKRVLMFSVQGWQMMPVPFLIASFMVLIVMVGAVYERAREIAVLGAVGLAPSQVGGMFFAEAGVYAIISAVIGYLVGITGTNVLVATGSMPEGFIPSFASTYVIFVILLCLGATLGSTLYPVRMASRITTPSLERKWRITFKPRGDEWVIPMPFTSSNREATGILAYMDEYFQAHKVEHSGAVFVVRESTMTEEGETMSVEAMVILPPYDAHIRQRVRVVATTTAGRKDRMRFGVEIKRETGMREPWVRSNYAFADAIRHQLLLWRALRPQDRERYVRMGKGLPDVPV